MAKYPSTEDMARCMISLDDYLEMSDPDFNCR